MNPASSCSCSCSIWAVDDWNSRLHCLLQLVASMQGLVLDCTGLPHRQPVWRCSCSRHTPACCNMCASVGLCIYLLSAVLWSLRDRTPCSNNKRDCTAAGVSWILYF